jgi:hypothetical protein
MNTITKGDFLRMVKLHHLEVLTQAQLSQNTKVINGYMQKALTAELSADEVADSNAMISDVGSLQQWEVLRDDFTKAVVYTRREQVDWEGAERGEFGELIKARGGVYKLTGENKKLGRVGQKYGEEKKEDTSKNIDPEHVQNVNAALVKMRTEGAKDLSDEEIERTLKDTVAAPGLIRLIKHYRDEGKIDKSWVNKEGKKDKVIEHYKEATKGQVKKLSTIEVDKLHHLVTYSRKPYAIDDIEETAMTPEIKTITDKLPVIKSQEKTLSEAFKNFMTKDCPKEVKDNPYIADLGGAKFLVDPQGYDYPRYVTKLVGKVRQVE